MHNLSNVATFNDILTSDPDFKVTTFFEVEYRKRVCLKDKVTIAQ